MNLLVSYNWLKEYLPGLKASPEEVAEKLSLHAFSVERWYRMNEGLDGVVVGEILEFHKHPNADKLRLVKCRMQNAECRIVCGGSNLYEGQLVAVALPGAKVRWHGEGESVELQPAEIRGVKSEGMICAANEIGLEALTHNPHPSPLPGGEGSRRSGEGKSDREILDLTATGARVGESVSKALGLDDTVFEVEVTTNRPDAMGVIGIAREVGAIFNVELRIKNEELKVGHNAPRPPLNLRGGGLGVKVEVPKLCPRYMGVVMEGIKVAPSPWWMQQRLIASGVRPINNIVDITNYVLLEYGQPCHAFDFDKLEWEKSETLNSKLEINSKSKIQNSKQIVVRMAKKGEKILALDGKSYDLDERVLVIADAVKPVAIAGIMGGEETGVNATTTRIVFEAASFDPLTVRKGEHQLGLSSDSSARFNKGLPVQLPEFAAARLVELAQEIAGGKVVQVVDRPSPGLRPSSPKGRGKVNVVPKEIQKLIGVEIPATQMKKYLVALGFTVKGSVKKWSVSFPYWREVEADGLSDVAEEVARMYGYHRIEGKLPEGTLPSALPQAQFTQEAHIKEALRGVGYTELYTYSFVSKDDLVRAGFSGEAGSGSAGDPVSDALALSNPLTSEMTHMRPWLGISVLKAVADNQKVRDELRLFELSAEYHPRTGELPDERQKLIVISAGKEEKDGAHFYAMKGIAEHLAQVLGIPLFGYEKVVATAGAPWVKHYHPSRVLLCKSGRDILGVVGELHPSLLGAYGIEHRVAFLEWEMKALLPLLGQGRVYVAPLAYPKVLRDIAFLVSKEVEYAMLVTAMRSVDPLIANLELFDQYEGKGVPEGSLSLAFHIGYAAPDRTLKGEEADKAHGKLAGMLKEKFGATIRE